MLGGVRRVRAAGYAGSRVRQKFALASEVCARAVSEVDAFSEVDASEDRTQESGLKDESRWTCDYDESLGETWQRRFTCATCRTKCIAS